MAAGLRELEAKYYGLMSNVRGVGLYQGFSLETKELKSRLGEMALREEGLFLLGAGSRSFRTRPNLSVTEADIDLMLAMLGRCLGKLAGDGLMVPFE